MFLSPIRKFKSSPALYPGQNDIAQIGKVASVNESKTRAAFPTNQNVALRRCHLHTLTGTLLPRSYFILSHKRLIVTTKGKYAVIWITAASGVEMMSYTETHKQDCIITGICQGFSPGQALLNGPPQPRFRCRTYIITNNVINTTHKVKCIEAVLLCYYLPRLCLKYPAHLGWLGTIITYCWINRLSGE